MAPAASAATLRTLARREVAHYARSWLFLIGAAGELDAGLAASLRARVTTLADKHPLYPTLD